MELTAALIAFAMLLLAWILAPSHANQTPDMRAAQPARRMREFHASRAA